MQKTAHISQFPAEILGQVLLSAKCDGIEVTNPATFPVNLCLVCKTWRAVVVSTPGIWSHIHVNLDQSNSAVKPSSPSAPLSPGFLPHNAVLEALQTCLDRSKHQPLTVRVFARSLVPSSQNESTMTNNFTNSSSRGKDLLASILVTLLRYSGRWLEVEFDFALDLFMLITPPGRHYPLLEKLILGCRSGNFQGAIMSFESLLISRASTPGTFSNTPRLTRLEIVRLPGYVHRFSLPWCQITHLTISLSANIFIYGLKLASNMPKLISLGLRQLGSGLNEEDTLHFPLDSLESPTCHECPHIEEFSLSCWRGVPPSATYFFLGLCMPRLRALRLLLQGGLCPLGDSWFNAFKTFISRCTIHRLTLGEMKAANVLAILRALGSVEELVLERIRFSKELLMRLTYRDYSFRTEYSLSHKKRRPIARRVSKLTIKYPQFVDHAVGPDQFTAMICSRLPRRYPSRPETQYTAASSSCSPSTKPTLQGDTTALAFLRIVTESPRDSGESLQEGFAGDLYLRLSKMLLEHQWDDLGLKVVLEKH